MDQHTFTNMVKSLHNIDRHDLPELSAEQWLVFRDKASRYFIRAPDAQQDAIFREVAKRQSK